jgi:hypothetical protein
MLRRTFGPKREEVKGVWRKFQKDSQFVLFTKFKEKSG